MKTPRDQEYSASKMIWNPSRHNSEPITVTVPSQAALLDDLRQRLAAGVGFAVATLNLDHVVKLRTNAAFRQAYAAQTHVTADGRPIVWLSRYARHPVELVTGSDLMEPAMRLCAEMSAPVALFGATQDVLETSSALLQERYPGLVVAAKIAPPMGFDPDGPEAQILLEDMAGSGARVCFLALGAPKQEILAARAFGLYPQMGFFSIGASLDFIAGTQVRAPRVMRALAAEWLWRLACDPRRLAARYGACLTILPGLALHAMHARRRAGQAASGRGAAP